MVGTSRGATLLRVFGLLASFSNMTNYWRRWQFLWWGRMPVIPRNWGPWPKTWREKGYPRPVYDLMWYCGWFEIRRFTK